jgi:MFS family permease
MVSPGTIEHPTGKPGRGKPQSASQLVWIALAELLGMSLWFAATAVAPALAGEFTLGEDAIAWLTMAVQLGFVVGTLASALINLPDIVAPRRVFAGGCVAGAIFTISALAAPSAATLIAGRFFTGVALACVYPPAMKIAAGWTIARRGTALGLLIGALTLGSAGPHVLAAVSTPLAWLTVMIAVALQAIAGAAIMLFVVRDGPYVIATSRFDPRAALVIFREPRARAATLGYLGHMWELYGCWTWIAAFGAASAIAHGSTETPWGPVTAAMTLAAGAPACLIAGIAADRIGKAQIARMSLVTSGALAALTPLCFGRAPWLLLALAALWGAAVIADSAQFSAMIAEYSDPTHIGTALTLQTCAGFLLTMVSIKATSAIAQAAGWQWALAPLALGPVFGVIGLAPLASTHRRERNRPLVAGD